MKRQGTGPWFFSDTTCFPPVLGTEEFTSELCFLYLMSLLVGKVYKQGDNRQFVIARTKELAIDGSNQKWHFLYSSLFFPILLFKIILWLLMSCLLFPIQFSVSCLHLIQWTISIYLYWFCFCCVVRLSPGKPCLFPYKYIIYPHFNTALWYEWIYYNFQRN